MTKLWFIVAAIVAVGSIADAQFLRKIRAGEHGAFTRVTVPVDPQVKWTAEAQKSQIAIQFLSSQGPFSTDELFNRIGNKRIVDVNSVNDGIIIKIGCDCGFNAFLDSQGLLVIDISERFRTGRYSADTEDANNTDIDFFGSAPDMTTENIVNLGRSMSFEESLNSGVIPLFLEIRRGNQTTPANEVPDQDNTAVEALAGVHAFITDATRAGLLVARQSGDHSLDTNTELDDDVLNNIVVSSLLESPMLKLNDEEGESADDECLSKGYFDLGSWTHHKGFDAGLGDYIVNLFAEFDTINSNEAIKLGRHLVYYGFGAEALALMALSPEIEKSKEAIKIIAELLEFGEASESDIFEEINCDGVASFWKFLADPTQENFKTQDRDAFMIAFNELPAHLQVEVLPLMVDRMQNFNSDSKSDSFLDNLKTSIDGLPALEMNAPPQPVSLNKNDSSPSSPVALLNELGMNFFASPSSQTAARLVEEEFWKYELSQEDLDLIGAVAFQSRQLPEGRVLNLHYILGLAYAGRFEDALFLLENNDYLDDQSTLVELKSEVFQRLSMHASDEQFLVNALNVQVNKLTSKAQVAVASRLVDLGLYSQALPLVRASGDPVDPAERFEREELRVRIAAALAPLQGGLAQVEESFETEADAQSNQSSGIPENNLLFSGENVEGGNFGIQQRETESRFEAPAGGDVFDAASDLGAANLGVEPSIEPTVESGELTRAIALIDESQKIRDNLLESMADSVLNSNAE